MINIIFFISISTHPQPPIRNPMRDSGAAVDEVTGGWGGEA
jgi:hypothetical protein